LPARRLFQLKFPSHQLSTLFPYTTLFRSGNRVENLPKQAHHDACIEALKRAADIAAKQNLTLLLENIDQEENPRYYLTSVAEGFEIVRNVGNPNVKFLYDFYHEQISEGNLIKKLKDN